AASPTSRRRTTIRPWSVSTRPLDPRARRSRGPRDRRPRPRRRRRTSLTSRVDTRGPTSVTSERRGTSLALGASTLLLKLASRVLTVASLLLVHCGNPYPDVTPFDDGIAKPSRGDAADAGVGAPRT